VEVNSCCVVEQRQRTRGPLGAFELRNLIIGLDKRNECPYLNTEKLGEMMKAKLPPFLMTALFSLVFIIPAAPQQQVKAEFMSLNEAQPILRGFSAELPHELGSAQDETGWSNWVKAQDASIRQRLEKGEEDTLTNLLRWGVAFTDEYQINREYLSRYGTSTLVNAFAEKRADDLVRALSSPNASEAMREMRVFLMQRGYSFKTSDDRARVKKHLLENLARMRDEFAEFRQRLKTADLSEEGELYAKRGISLDSNLWPDYAVDRSLTELVKLDMIKPGSVQRIAIIGPGLDFANKEFGNDFYPPQSVQPFAVVDSLIRLGLTDPKSFELYTFDISPSVNIHLARMQKNAADGKAYVIQLPWNSEVPFSPEYFFAFDHWWQTVGNEIGAPAKPVHIPSKLARAVHIRAVSVRPEIARRITPIDMNAVFQHLDGVGADQKFDLIIGTNVFIYYGALEQSLARANLFAMLKPGGFALINDMLADRVRSHLQEVHRTNIEVRPEPQIIEHVYCYRREP